MTLEEAIEHTKEVSETEECENCANEHKQLYDWLSELKELKNKYLYLASDFDNYKKRTKQQESYIHDKAYEDVINRFLDVYDDMEKLHSEIEKRTDYSDTIEVDIGPVDSGYEMIFENFEKTLNSLGCEKIEVEQGDEFDVETMDAISTRKIEEFEKKQYKDNSVAQIFSTGWKMKGKVIKPTRVVVGKI